MNTFNQSLFLSLAAATFGCGQGNPSAGPRVEVVASQETLSRVEAAPGAAVPRDEMTDKPADRIAQSQIEDLVARIAALPDVNQQAIERLFGVELTVQSAIGSRDPIYAADLRSGPFRNVELRRPGGDGKAVFLLLRVREGQALPFSAFRDGFRQANAIPTPGAPGNPNPTRSYHTGPVSGYRIAHTFEERTDQLTLVTLRKVRDDA